MPESEVKEEKAGEMSRGFRPKRGASSKNNRVLLHEQLNLEHPLVKLSQAIAWQEFEAEFGNPISREGGRPALSSRLMVGLHYLKALYKRAMNRWLPSR